MSEVKKLIVRWSSILPPSIEYKKGMIEQYDSLKDLEENLPEWARPGCTNFNYQHRSVSLKDIDKKTLEISIGWDYEPDIDTETLEINHFEIKYGSKYGPDSLEVFDYSAADVEVIRDNPETTPKSWYREKTKGKCV